MKRTNCTLLYVDQTSASITGFSVYTNAMNSLILQDARDYIRLELELRQRRRTSYSLRAFARDLKMSPSFLSDFLSGRVGMSHARVEWIAGRLGWSETAADHFWDLLQTKFAKTVAARKNARLKAASRLKQVSVNVSIDAFKAISDWYHLVLLEIYQIKGEKADAKQIARKLGLCAATVREASERLERLGLVRRTAHGYVPVESETWIGDDLPSEAVRIYHVQVLNRAIEAVDKVRMEERESLSLVFSIDRSEFEKMHKELRSAVMRVVQKYAQQTPADQVQCLALHTFPVWRGDS